ncbi:hypothetical protein [Teredinibacter sp. KSP-S5-2]|uniref:hypothetical protein n=1 Tax=Teredinibacter sp. KSP-S5-2 TaxID=3034506 RepID=UPI0029351413|nr:hypothetical protein [Teredinibacter sp. KSP-S5-2]WNO10537.1 hypothetical protein P5V12_05060 [Teredinibacter sp. KSP-S5-2]
MVRLSVSEIKRCWILIVVMITTGCPATIPLTEIDVEKRDLHAAFQSLLDYPSLQQYFHPELEDRVPVVVKTNGHVPPGIDVIKFGLPVKFMAQPKSGTYLDVHQFYRIRNDIHFDIDYPVEGVFFRGRLIKEKTHWRVHSEELTEY